MYKQAAISDNFSGVLEAMIMNLDYIFAPFVLFFVFFYQKMQTMNKQLLDGFSQNSNILLQILIIILKSRCHSKIIWFFSYYLNQHFP